MVNVSDRIEANGLHCAENPETIRKKGRKRGRQKKRQNERGRGEGTKTKRKGAKKGHRGNIRNQILLILNNFIIFDSTLGFLGIQFWYHVLLLSPTFKAFSQEPCRI